jgi:hypothetical protein
VLTRQKEFLQWLAGGFTTSFVIVGGVWLTDHRDLVIAEVFGSPNFSSASSASIATEPSKLDVLKGNPAASPESEHKASGSMQVTLMSPEGRKSDGSLALQAYVTATADLSDLKYEWVLPDGAAVSSGSTTGSFGNVSDGTQVSASIVVNVPASNTHIVFHAYREMAGEKVGQVAQYNTVEQSTIDMKLALKRESLQRAPSSTDRRFE